MKYGIAIGLFLFSTLTYAQTVQFFGLRLNEKLELAACPQEVMSAGINHLKADSYQGPTCFWKDGETSSAYGHTVQEGYVLFAQGYLPQWLVYNNMVVSVMDGRLVSIRAVTGGMAYQVEIKDFLWGKLGKPVIDIVVDRHTSGEIKNYLQTGAIAVAWVNGNILTTLWGQETLVDSGMLTIRTKEYEELGR